MLRSILLSVALFLGMGSISFGEPAFKDGSILYITNGNQIVQRVTESDITHIAVIINIDDESYVYEAEIPQVRRMKLTTYKKMLGQHNKESGTNLEVFVMEPIKEFTQRQINAMKNYMDSMIGGRYSIRGYLHKHTVKSGVHCAEFTAVVLNKTGVFNYKNPSACSPKTVVFAAKDHELYDSRTQVDIDGPIRSWSDRENERWNFYGMAGKWGAGETYFEAKKWFWEKF